MSRYEELEAVVAAVDGLNRSRSEARIARAMGADEDRLRELRDREQSAALRVERAALKLATSERLAARAGKAEAELERREAS